MKPNLLFTETSFYLQISSNNNLIPM